MNKYLLTLCSLLFVPVAAHAVCPVCTIAVGAGLEGMRLLGVDDVLTGIWAGGLTLSLVFWTANWMHRKGIQNAIWYLLDFIVYYGLLASVYLLPSITFGSETMWGMDKLLLGIIVGTIGFWIGAKWHANIKKKNGGKSWFKLQKVVWPFGALVILTALFTAIIYL
ncbi:MAG: hypothetical protein FWG80_01780 [Alphaproteobacteria bacterium]|nr:hypothetical protein [Alphaproteobacteria bacterium]